jgi:hypothetical protein
MIMCSSPSWVKRGQGELLRDLDLPYGSPLILGGNKEGENGSYCYQMDFILYYRLVGYNY